MLMSHLVRTSTHWRSAMPANQHTPQQIEVFAWFNLMLVQSGCLSLVLCDLKKICGSMIEGIWMRTVSPIILSV